MVLILVGTKAIRFSVNTALEKNNCKILTLTLPALKDYKRELTEKKTPNTAVIIFIPLFNFPPWELTFFWGGGRGVRKRRKAYFRIGRS